MIQLHAVVNPFQPIASRVTHEVEWHEGMTLADVLDAAGVSSVRHSCVVDGLAVPEEMLAGFPVADGATVVSMPSVAGGGFGKMFAEIAVLVAATVITGGLAAGPLAALGATGFGAMLAGAGLGGLSAGTASLIGAGIALGGNLLVNAFMGNAAAGPDSASLDPTGPATVASGGTPIPKGYGKFQSGGNIIASYVTAEGLDNYLNVLVCYGWGPATSITNVEINNNSIQNYSATTYMIRYGSNQQTPIPYFNNIVNGYPQDIRCYSVLGDYGNGNNKGTPIVIQGTGTATQGLQVVIQFPNGVFYSNSDGSLRSLSIAYKIEYSVSGENNWQVPVIPRTTHDLITYTDDGTVANYPGWVVVPTDGNFSSGVVYDHDNNMDPNAYTPGQPWTGTQTVTYYNSDGSSYQGSITLNGEWQRCDPNLNQQIVYDWSGGFVIFTDANQSTLYHTTNIYNLPAAKYDVRVSKYGTAFTGDSLVNGEANNDRTGDQVWVHSINEVQYQDLAYPNMILCGVRALATDQVSGANIKVTALINYGITVQLPAALASFGTDNPAVVAYDMLVAQLYGGGVDPANIDVPAFAEWAAYNDELVSDGFEGQIKRHVFNGVFDAQGTNLWKSLQKVAMMSQAVIVQIGALYTVVVDKPVTVPAQIFTVGNTVRDSIKDTWLSFDDRANRIEVTFADAERNYRTDEPCAVMLPSDIQAGVEAKPTRVTLLGCTDRAQAWHWAYRKIQSTDLLLLTRSFDVNVEAVACQVGSVIGVQDDVTAYANGGRIQAGSTAASLIIDLEGLEFSEGNGWTVSILHPVVERGAGVIQSIAGNVLTFAAALPAGNVASVENAAGSMGVVQGVVQGSSNALNVTSVAGFAPGQVVSFYDQDVIDTQPVASVNGTILVPVAPFVQAPTEDCPWVYGQSAGAFPAKLFTVTNIRKKGDFQLTIDTIEYNPAIYADDTPIITDTLGTPDSNAAVASLTANENYVMANGANGGQMSTINVGWIPGPNTAAVELWVARNAAGQPISAPNLVQTVTKGTTASLTYPTGSIVQISAVGVDAKGATAPYATAPSVTITVQGSGTAPADVTGFAGVLSSAGTALTWSAVPGAASYEVRYNADTNNTSWTTAQLLYAGSALAYTDATVRTGCYLVKALTSAAVESIDVASWNYLAAPARVNIALQAGQTVTVNVTVNTYDPTTQLCSVTLSVPAQPLYRIDGTLVSIPASGLEWVTELQPGTEYYFPLYLAPTTYTLGCSTGGNTLPPTTADAGDIAGAYANGNYPVSLLTVTTPTSATSGSGSGTGGGGVGTPSPITPPPSGGRPIDRGPVVS